jgi:hypothetical protein
MGKIPNPSVEGTSLDDVMTPGYTDGDGDMVTNGSEDIFGFDVNDDIAAGGGKDRVWGGDGQDTIEARRKKGGGHRNSRRRHAVDDDDG